MRTHRGGSAWIVGISSAALVVACGSAAPSSSRGPASEPARWPAVATTSPAASGPDDVTFADVPFMRGDSARTSIEPGPGPVSRPIVAWDVPLDAEASLNPILVDGLAITGTPTAVIAIDVRTGSPAWRTLVDGRLEGGLGSAEGIVVAAAGSLVVGLDVATGAIRWSDDLQTTNQRPDIVDGVAYLGTTDGLVEGLDVTTGAKVWSWQGPHQLEMRVDVVADGVVYVSSNDGRLFTVKVSDASEGWAFQAPTIRVSPSVVGSTVYAASAADEVTRPIGQVAAIDAATGQVAWRFSPPSGGQAVHGAVRDGMVVVTTRDDGAYGLRETDGATMWHNSDVPVTDWPSVLAGDIVYVATRDQAIYALDVSSGRVLWHTDGAGIIRGPVVSGGLVIATLGSPGHVIAWGEPQRVAELPIATAAPTARPSGPALPPNPLTIVRSFDAATTGVETGSRATGPEGIQAAFGPNGRLYVLDIDGHGAILDPATGRPVATFGGPGHGDGQFDGRHDLAVGPDGRVYAADGGNHRVEVFGPDGRFERQIGTFGSGLGQFSEPTHVAVGPDGSLYVQDGTTITRFGPDGDVDWRVGGSAETNVELRRETYDLAVLPGGRILVALDPGGSLLVLDAEGAVVGRWGPDDIAASPEPVVAPDGRVWMFEYVSERIDVFETDGTRIGTLDMERRDVSFPQLYPTPVIGPNGHAYTFNEDLGLVELAVDLPPH